MLWSIVLWLGHMIGVVIITKSNKIYRRAYHAMNIKVEAAVDRMHNYSTKVKTNRKRRRMANSTFDTDSGTVGIDNRASGCFSHVIDDFVGPVRDCNRIVKGFGGSKTSNVKIGTLKWSWEDDKGLKTTHLIPNSYYSQLGGVRLLSPQHFAQVSSNKGPRAGSKTTAKDITLYWGEGATKTVSL